MTISILHATLKKGWLIAAAILAVVTFWTVQHATAATTESSDQRMVTIYDRGTERTIITRANTVQNALDQAGITTDPADITEPKLSQELVAKNYHVNIYRARPVLIIDGISQFHVITAAQSPRQIVKTAELTLYDEDTTTLDRVTNDDVLTDGGAGLKLNITRATPFSFVLYGKKFTARTQADTVGEMLAEKGVKLGSKDGTSVPLSTPIKSGMKVQVWRDGVQTVTQEESIPMPVEKIQDQDRPVGYSDIKTEGKDGKKEVTYQIKTQNGKEVSRKKIQEVQTLAPEKQVEIVGAKAQGGTPAQNRALGHQMMLSAGFSESQWTCLDALWGRESGWDHHKSNYAGSGAYGIPQALPGSKMGDGWENDAAVQIRWGLGYIKGRYGTPCNADATQARQGWY